MDNKVVRVNRFLRTRKGVHKFIFFALAIFSFFPSFIFISLFLLLLFFIYFSSAGIKYLFYILVLILFTLLSMLVQETFFYKGPLLTVFILLPFLLSFLFRKKKYRHDLYVVFMKTHIYISLLQVPIQLVQFIHIYGLNFSELLYNSSAGDVSFGTLHNSFVLADKQMLSMFFLFSLKKNFSKLFFNISFIILLFSFLWIGSNTTLLVFVLAIVIYVITFSVNLNNIKNSIKLLVATSLMIGSLFVISKFIFSSQYEHVDVLFHKGLESGKNIGKVQAFLSTIDIFSDHKEYLIFGLGSGYYSSRISFILGGEYLWQGELPLVGTQNSELFNRYLLPLWNDKIRFNVFLNNTMFQPFSSILTIYSEYGVIIFILFIILILKTYKNIHNNIGKIFIIFVMGMLMLDNFLEYPRLCTPALVYILYLAKRNTFDKKRIMALKYIKRKISI